MKLTQLITENQDPFDIFNRYFETDGDVHNTPDGLSVDGFVELKEGKRLKEIPIAFNKISGDFDLSTNTKLENLNNFPREIGGDVFIGGNTSLTSLATPYRVVCKGSVYADRAGITDLAGFQIYTNKLDLNSSPNLKSLDGIVPGTTSPYSSVDISYCESFEADLSKYKDFALIKASYSENSSMPLARVLAFHRDSTAKNLPIPFVSLNYRHISESEKLYKIVQKYHRCGPADILDIIRDFRDAGFERNARV